MADLDKKTLEEIMFFCSRGTFESSRKVDAEALEKELAERRAQGFTGVLCLTSGNGDNMSSDWIIIEDGEVKLVIFEENVKEKDGEKRVVEFRPKDGFLETFSLTDAQMAEISLLCGRPPESAPPEIPAGPGETPEKAPAEQKEPPAKAEELKETAERAEGETVPDRGKIVSKIKEVTEAQREAEIPSREEIMRKYHLKEPSEAYVESLLKGFRQPTEGDMIRCKSVVESIKGSLEEMFGEKMGQRMFEKQFKDLNIEEEYMTPKDVGRILESFQKNILEKVVGPENAEKAIKKLKREILPKDHQ
ncbi:MAG: DUF2226 domain-containing protein [Euryarchaeota archaeon]|nr:DUF2226 domain-containing protein [Euryarchaeota archaeon]